MAIKKEDTKNKLEESTNTWGYGCVRETERFSLGFMAREDCKTERERGKKVLSSETRISVVAPYNSGLKKKKYLKSIKTQFNDLPN